ncbi:MAG: hypothetical protein ACI80L_002925 [Pseudohongiellaceae bacterium]|jgi:uncharacterized protein (TIGR01777 family)
MAQSQSKNILITGASGMIGSALVEHLSKSGFAVHQLSRCSRDVPFYFDAGQGRVHLDQSIPLLAVINLAGPSIADKRWSESRKREILDSRQRLTHALATALAGLDTKPETFLSASAIGFYGETGESSVDENSPVGGDFLAEVAQAWEGATAPAEVAGINTIHLRFGIVLSPRGGVLKKLLLPFKLGLGGRIGNGKQGMSWISIADVVQVIHKLISDNPESGPINLVAQQPISNLDFTANLAYALHRPNFVPLPGFMVKLLLGEMGEALLLGSSRVTSRKLAQLGIQLEYPSLPSALTALLHPKF